MDYISLVIAIGTCLSAFAAFCALRNSIKVQKRTSAENKQRITIEAFNRMQDQVFDKLVSCSKEQIMYLVDDMDYAPRIKEACDDTRALIARCEHFAVGVNNDVYDFDLVQKLGGTHIVYVYDKVFAGHRICKVERSKFICGI